MYTKNIDKTMTNLKQQIETANSPCIFKFNSKLREIEREREREMIFTGRGV